MTARSLPRARMACAVITTTLLALAPAANAARFGDRPLRAGARGHDVRVLQSWLNHLGAHTSIDGRFGRGTARAVRAFERREGIRVDGVVSRSEARRLRAMIESTVGGASAPAPQTPVAPATIGPDRRTAIAPAGAPPAVAQVIAAANEITRTHYRYGGGHGRGFDDTAFDCSGAVSHALHGAALVTTPLDSTQFERWGSAGRGRWITVYANAGHAYMVVAGLRFDTSGPGESGPRWRPQARSSAGFTARHPAGL
jgi:peptidoglycan hydrolase-like protein with peptidoglycan-binding domain